MPAGPAPLGFLYFAAAKFVGYSVFCRYAIESQLDEPVREIREELFSSLEETPYGFPSMWKAGGIRTLIGLVIGVIIGLGFWQIPYFDKHDSVANSLFFSLLVPVRIGEWWLLLRWVYGNYALTIRERVTIIAIGIVSSFALDAIGIISAFILPGGMWVC